MGRQSRRPLQRPLLSPVGADDSVRPQTAPVFTGISGEFAAAQRADVGIGPTELRRIRTSLQVLNERRFYSKY